MDEFAGDIRARQALVRHARVLVAHVGRAGS